MTSIKELDSKFGKLNESIGFRISVIKTDSMDLSKKIRRSKRSLRKQRPVRQARSGARYNQEQDEHYPEVEQAIEGGHEIS